MYVASKLGLSTVQLLFHWHFKFFNLNLFVPIQLSENIHARDNVSLSLKLYRPFFVLIKQQQQHPVIQNERCRDGKKKKKERGGEQKSWLKESQTKQATDQHVFTKKWDKKTFLSLNYFESQQNCHGNISHSCSSWYLNVCTHYRMWELFW